MLRMTRRSDRPSSAAEVSKKNGWDEIFDYKQSKSRRSAGQSNVPKTREKPGFCARWVQSGGIRELNGWRERSWAQSGREERREEGRFPRGGCQMFFFLLLYVLSSAFHLVVMERRSERLGLTKLSETGPIQLTLSCHGSQ